MHPHGTCDTGDDAGSHATARTHAAPGRPGRGRLRSRPARAATVLLAAVAALLALPLQAQAQTAGIDFGALCRWIVEDASCNR